MNKIVWVVVGEEGDIFSICLTRREAREDKQTHIADDVWFGVPPREYRVIKCKLEEVKT